MKVHSFESMAAVDGDGIRLCIFLCGCPLRCVYCHNPDTWYSAGQDYTPEQLLGKAKRYKPYFGNKKGGVTFSGGEPLLQAEDIWHTGCLLNAEGINYAIDTSGAVPLTLDVKKTIAGAGLVICDLKFYDEYSYKKYTCGDYLLFLKTFDYLKNIGKRTWVRTVIIPGINDTTEDIDRYVEFLAGYPMVESYRLLGFHTMGFKKYEKLMINNPLSNTPQMDEQKLSLLQSYADKKLKEINY